ncbi:MAG: bifunctional phosphopantothenoylcysteine decarboxylase/phosphopantothenate--cysteine ligase CoaBC [Thermodesulfovibrionales bacterium]
MRKNPKNPRSLRNSRVLLAVTGSVAAYKAIDLTRRLKDEGASVRVLMTDASCRFVTPLSMELASGQKALTGTFQEPMSHISLPAEADLLVVAPATANSIGKFASGIADDLPSVCFMAFRGPVVVAPAMNWRMYENPVFRRNLDYLRGLGVVEVPPERGPLACGEEGVGRMAAVEAIVEASRRALEGGDLGGVKVVVTAGPTREFVDAVRFISNPSTGKMGYALARAALRRGAEVTLISGPSALEPPAGARFVPVVTAGEMRDAVMKELGGAHVLIMAAAVSDFAPASKRQGKADKSSIKSLRLAQTPDILKEAGSRKKRPLIVGFAAEAGDDRRRARNKMLQKNADMVVFNNIAEPGSGFGHDTNRVVILERDGETELPLLSKDGASDAILDRVSVALGGRPS